MFMCMRLNSSIIVLLMHLSRFAVISNFEQCLAFHTLILKKTRNMGTEAEFKFSLHCAVPHFFLFLLEVVLPEEGNVLFLLMVKYSLHLQY